MGIPSDSHRVDLAEETQVLEDSAGSGSIASGSFAEFSFSFSGSALASLMGSVFVIIEQE